MDEQSDIFSQLFVKTMEFSLRTKVEDVEAVMDNMLQLDYRKRIFAITNKIAGEVLSHFADNTRILTTTNEYTLNKFFQITVNLTSSQELTLESDIVNLLLARLSSVWDASMKTTVSLQGLLDAVSAVTYQNGPHITEENMEFLLAREEKNLVAIVQDSSFDPEAKRTALQCIAGLCAMTENGDQLADRWMEICMNVFLSVLQDQPADTTQDVATCRIIFSATKGLHNILSSTSNVHNTRMAPLLTVLKKFMFYGLPGLASSAPDELQPVKVPDVFPGKPSETEKQVETQNSANPQKSATKSKEKKKRRKPKPRSKSKDGDANLSLGMEQLRLAPASGFRGHMAQQTTMQFRPTWARVTSSESEYSDTEGAQKARLRSFLSKIRQMCLSILYLTVKRTPKHTILGYWSSFLPDSPSVSRNSSLFTSFRQDPAPKCRAAALGVVGAMLEGSRGFLSLAAEETGSPSQYQASSFVPFSASLAASIREIHKQLLSASSKEQSTLALVQLLKSISILVSNTPYHKMKPGLLVQLASQARHFLTNSRDGNVRVICMNILGAIASTSAPLGEVANIITDTSALPLVGTSSPFSGNRTPTLDSAGSKSEDSQPATPWFLRNSMELAMPHSMVKNATQPTGTDSPEIPHPLRVEALQTMARVVKSYLSAVRSYIIPFADLICNCLQDGNLPVRLNACKVLEELGSSLLHLHKTSPSKALEEEMVLIWKKFLSGPLQGAMQEHGSSNLQSKACDSLSTIGSTTFHSLPHNLRIMCITLLLGFTSDENAYVRSTSVRALGVYVMFPCLREDVAFLEDVVGTVLRLLDDSFLNVRANAAWSLGNLTDTIIVNKETKLGFQEEFQSSLLLQLFNRGIKSMEDKDKVRFNMMRVLGNLLRFAEKRHVDDERFKTVMLKASEVLAQMVAGNAMVKVRWNACIACSNFLRNENLPLGSSEWTDKTYQALCDTVASCKNFKVRIKAALALATPSKRSHYGSMYNVIFTCLIRGLEESDTGLDFTEFKFKDTLQEQLCSTLIHLVLLMERCDLPASSSSLLNNAEVIREQMSAYHRKIQHAAEAEISASASTSTSSGINGPGLDTSGESGTLDPVEEYIVIKQLSAKEKLGNLAKAVKHVNLLAGTGDVNDNSEYGAAALVSKGALAQSDNNLLKILFSFENLST